MLNQSRFNRSQELQETELDPAFRACPFCASGDLRAIGPLQEKPLIIIRQCRKCFAGFIDRQPNDAFLGEYYRNYYGGRARGTTMRAQQLAAHILKLAGKLPQKKQFRILDFGGGDGGVAKLIALHLLEKKRAEEIHITIVDPNASATPAEKNISVELFHELGALPAAAGYDLVLASAVLEHVKEPRKILLSLFQKMAANGLFYARTPYAYPLYRLGKIFGLRYDLQYPGHLFDMGNLFWRDVLKNLQLVSTHELQRSKTSLVETRFGKRFFQTLFAHLLKAPSRIFGNAYHLVGGWEVIIKRK